MLLAGPEDFEALDLLSTVRDEIAGTEAPYWIILTKCDSLSPELLAASYHCIQQDLKKYGKHQEDLPMVSSSLFVGIAELWDRIHTGVRDHIDNHDPAPSDWEIEYEDDVKEAKKAIDEVSALKVPELKQRLKDLGMPTDGKKAVLVDRLKDARTALVPPEEARLAEADKPEPEPERELNEAKLLFEEALRLSEEPDNEVPDTPANKS